jgi:hypothetical protein
MFNMDVPVVPLLLKKALSTKNSVAEGKSTVYIAHL